ncbi:MAG: Yip1 family protein [Gemmatimonadales bacterium]
MNLVDRVKAILLTPRKEWPVIDAEPATISSLYSSYVLPLAAIPPIASFIGWSLIGETFFGTTIRLSITQGIESALVRYILSLASVYVLALIIDALAPNFDGQKSQIQAFKIAAYSSTAAWVAGIFMVVPALGILAILGLYSLYLLYLGLPVLMKSPQDKAAGYTVVVIVCAIVLYLIVGVIVLRVVPIPIGTSTITAP